MGMAASQARFLGLTARMNNIEYEGQQINQQRTALSNKTASYYSDLLGMAVPTCPSVEEFTKTVYTFNDGALTNQITSLIADATNPGKYKVSYIRSWTDDFSVVSAAPSIVTEVDKANGIYKIGATKLEKLFNGTVTTNATTGKKEITPATAYAEDARDDDYWKGLSEDQRKNLLIEEKAYLNLLRDQHGNADDYFVRYVQNTATGEYEAIFYNEKNLTDAIYSDETHNSQSFIAAYKVGSAGRTEEIKGLEGCEIEQDSTGRYINIKLGTDGKTYALSTNTVTDQDAYEDAMNQYEYDKAIYDQSIEEINAKIEIIQAEDKNLELRLKQLDTEHNAVSNEKDAVSKVIEKAVESGFKTFG